MQFFVKLANMRVCDLWLVLASNAKGNISYICNAAYLVWVDFGDVVDATLQ
jgi:hypothetical protein